MKILGFNFTKISAERFPGKTEDIKINTNIDISDIQEVKSEMFNDKEKLLGVKFINTINYDPNFAKIELGGTILLTFEEKEAKKILNDWKDKKLAEELRLALFNLILKKSSIKSLQLEEEINIPLHIPMPSLKEEVKKNNLKE